MATASTTFTKQDMWDDGKFIHVVGTLAIDAAPDTYLVGGLDIAIPALPGVTSYPVMGRITGISGYMYEYVPSTYKVQIKGQKNAAADYDPLLEMLTAGAIPAGVSNDTISCYFIYKKFKSV